MKNYILAHDLGTTGNKATLYDREGCLVGSAFSAYETLYAHANWAEQSPEAWWRSVCHSTRELWQKTGVRNDEIACIVFSGQMMGCVPLDKKAQPLREAIIWADQRAVHQVRWLNDRVPREEFYQITGHRLGPSYSLSKILWLRDHQPDIYRATHKFVQAKDAIVARLTGNFVTDPSDASGMNLYDLARGEWSAYLVEAAGLDLAQLPEIRPSVDVAGEILPEVAEEAGLARGTPVVIGGGDGACATVGAGVVREGAAYNYIGSSSWIAIASAKPLLDPEFKTFTFAHAVPGMFMPMGTMQTAGASYQWARDQLGQVEIQSAASLGLNPYDLMNLEAKRSPAGANGLIYLPYLLGERSPRWNPNARGAFIGLTIRHSRADMIRAVLEGVSLNLRAILEALISQGAQIDEVRLIGGGARGRFWNQMLADVFGLPVRRLSILEEATSMGAAVIGGVGVGLYPDFSMSEQMNPAAELLAPEPNNQTVYNQVAPIFEAAYQALVPVYDALARIHSG